MTKNQKTQTKPFSLRLTFNELAQLNERADGTPIGTYIRSELFDDDEIDGRKDSVEGRTKAAKVLSALGHSEISKHLRELVRASRSGSLVLTPDTQNVLEQALKDVMHMRKLLLVELGIQSGLEE